MEIHISVRNLVEFLLRSGNIDNRRATSPENAMQEGGRIHRMIQRRMGADYHAEVFLRYVYTAVDYGVQTELLFKAGAISLWYRNLRSQKLLLHIGIL